MRNKYLISKHPTRLDTARRAFLRQAATFGGLALLGQQKLSLAEEMVKLPFENGDRALVAYPQKKPLMLMTARPVQLETPLTYFDNTVFTPNDVFFVRWHLANMPTSIDPQTFRLTVRGRVKNTLNLSLDDLRNNYQAIEVAAVCQCSGNSRGLFSPRVGGGQWGNGAMGNALWKGVRLRDILEQAGLQEDALQIRFDGLDKGVLPQTPDFIKALAKDVALSDDVIVAYAMNGEPLPLLNGYPLRLVAPGWYATYWVKMLHDIEAISAVDESFWMKPAYRIPANACACVEPGQPVENSVPINLMNVRSFITSHSDGERIDRTAQPEVAIRGIAFDGGYGISRVLLSSDGGKTWSDAELDEDHGNYSFRLWRSRFKPAQAGDYQLQCMAINRIGETQRDTPRWNPSGYMRNLIETVRVQVA